MSDRPAEAPAPSPEVTATTERRRRFGRGERDASSDGAQRRELASAEPPYPGARVLRLALGGTLFALSLLTLAGALLMLLLWQQHRDAGVLTTQIDRTWDLFGHLRSVERLLAFAALPMALAWAALATFNARRATGQRRSAVVPVVALAAGVAGVWVIGAELVAGASGLIDRSAGYVLQAIAIAIPLLAFERVAEAAEARRRPMHITAILAVTFVIVLQELGGLSTVAPTTNPEEWAGLGINLVILALVQALGALAATEAARAIEEGTQHRYDLRSRFSQSVLHQAGLD
jgi:hypothetical protein